MPITRISNPGNIAVQDGGGDDEEGCWAGCWVEGCWAGCWAAEAASHQPQPEDVRVPRTLD